MAVFSKHSQLSHQIDVKFDRQFPKTRLFHPHMQLSSFFHRLPFWYYFWYSTATNITPWEFSLLSFSDSFLSNPHSFLPKIQPKPAVVQKSFSTIPYTTLERSPNPSNSHRTDTRSRTPATKSSSSNKCTHPVAVLPQIGRVIQSPQAARVTSKHDTKPPTELANLKNPFPSTPTPSMRLWCT